MGERGHRGHDVGGFDGHTPELWWLAAGVYGVGDLVTTLVGLTTGRAVEVGPVAVLFVHEHGLAAVFPLKLASLLLFYPLWWRCAGHIRRAVPIGLTTLDVVLTIRHALGLFGVAPTL